MKHNDAMIHQREMLITIDYLLNYTDINHPASQQDICRHATNFGLKYDPKATNGNDIRRQRIGDCLQYLILISDKFRNSDKIPFIVNCTDTNKFYIEEKNHLDEEQIVKILSAIKNDKYTRDEDTDFLTERILDAFSNYYNREHLKKEANKAKKGVNKYNIEIDRKMKAVYQAYNEGKMIKIEFEYYDEAESIKRQKRTFNHKSYWYRVYKIQEFQGKPYAVLLRVTNDNIRPRVSKSMIFDTIENLNIPKEKDIISDDMDKNRDFEQLFKENLHFEGRYYKTLDDKLAADIRPDGFLAFVMSFYFRIENEEKVCQSFEDFFSKPLKYTKCVRFKTLKESHPNRVLPMPFKTDKGLLVPEDMKDNEKARYGVANVLVNAEAFTSWVMSQYATNRFVSSIIKIVGPTHIKERIAGEYSHWLYLSASDLCFTEKKRLVRKLQFEIEKQEKEGYVEMYERPKDKSK